MSFIVGGYGGGSVAAQIIATVQPVFLWHPSLVLSLDTVNFYDIYISSENVLSLFKGDSLMKSKCYDFGFSCGRLCCCFMVGSL